LIISLLLFDIHYS